MSQYSYNLVDEKWIPCIMLDGNYIEIGIRETFLNAHNIKEIFDSSPLINAALYRFLLVILHRVFGPESINSWESLWKMGQFNMTDLASYLDRWYDRFDLFNDVHPFYQKIVSKKKVKQVPINDLIPELARGNNPTLFDHTTDDNPPPLSANQAAKILLAIQQFKLGGLSGLGENFVDAPAARNALFFVRGSSLFKTLMLNMVNYDKHHPIPGTNEDMPVWERDNIMDSSVPQGYLDYLTWQTLYIRLYPYMSNGGIKVVNCELALGRNMDNTIYIFDPFVAFVKNKRNKDQGWFGLRFDRDRALWRDSTSFLSFYLEDKKPPEILRWLRLLTDKAILDKNIIFQLDAIGIGAKQAKIFLWRHESLPLPLVYLNDENLSGDLQLALTYSENAAIALKSTLRSYAMDILFTPERPPDWDIVRDYIEHFGGENIFWSELEIPFYHLLIALPMNRKDAFTIWLDKLRQMTWIAFDSVTRDSDNSARTLKALVKARRNLGIKLKQALENNCE